MINLFKNIKLSKKTNKKITIISSVISGVLILMAILLLFKSVISVKNNKLVRIFGYSFSTVVSPSMEPTINVGDMIIVKDTPFNKIKDQDIIVYYNSELNINVVHRVVGFTSDGALITKGDNNATNPINDTVFTTEENLIGKVVKHGKFLNIGSLDIETSRTIIFIVIILVFLYIIILEINNIIKELKKKQKEELEKNTLSKEEILEIEREKIRQELLKEMEEKKGGTNN